MGAIRKAQPEQGRLTYRELVDDVGIPAEDAAELATDGPTATRAAARETFNAVHDLTDMQLTASRRPQPRPGYPRPKPMKLGDAPMVLVWVVGP